MVDQEQEKYLTNDQLNNALAAQKRDFEKKLLSQMQEMQKSFQETLTQFLPQQKSETAPLPTKQELSEDTAELKKQIKVLMERDKQREATEKQMKMTQAMRDNLNKNGISSKADLAIKYLSDQVSYDEDGQLVMKVDEISYPLQEAIAKFSQTDNGKFLSDPRDLRGSGHSRSIQSPQQSPTQQITGFNEKTPIFKDLNSMKNFAANSFEKDFKW